MHTRRIVGFTGYHFAGKDEAAKILSKYGYDRIAFADPVREGLLRLDPLLPLADGFGGKYRVKEAVKVFGWDRLKKECPEVRELLQRYGTEAGRDIHGEDCWVNVWSRKVDGGTKNVAATDLHFANEGIEIRRRGGVVIWIDNPKCAPVNDHKSNAILAYDDVVRNDSDLVTYEARLLETIDRAFERKRKRDVANN